MGMAPQLTLQMEGVTASRPWVSLWGAEMIEKFWIPQDILRDV